MVQLSLSLTDEHSAGTRMRDSALAALTGNHIHCEVTCKRICPKVAMVTVFNSYDLFVEAFILDCLCICK